MRWGRSDVEERSLVTVKATVQILRSAYHDRNYPKAHAGPQDAPFGNDQPLRLGYSSL